MIPALIEAHFREHHGGFEHHRHPIAVTAQDLAQVEHVSGFHVAKPVVVKLGGELVLAVVSAAEHVSLAALEEATGSEAELVMEQEFVGRFGPCEAGAEPALALFGVPIFADEKLLHDRKLLMPAGTHEDSVVLDMHEWMRCEKVQPVANLGVRSGERH